MVESLGVLTDPLQPLFAWPFEQCPIRCNSVLASASVPRSSFILHPSSFILHNFHPPPFTRYSLPATFWPSVFLRALCGLCVRLLLPPSALKCQQTMPDPFSKFKHPIKRKK